MTPQQKNHAGTEAFMAKHGPEIQKWYTGVLKSAGGLPPFDRKTAVAHEAGHTVVGLTLGGTFKHTSVYQEEPRIWCGWSEITWPPYITEQEEHVLTQPRAALHGLLYQIAGYVGESEAGLEHPANSPDEVFPTLQACAAVGYFKGIDPAIVMGRVMGDARFRIERNRSLFDGIRAAMRRQDSLPPATMSALLDKHGLVQVPLQAAW